MRITQKTSADIMGRIEELAALSESPDGLTRRYLTPEHRQANELVGGWMQQAGMSVHQDAIGNIVGRYEGASESLPALIIGSHLDTVVMAGRYDGMLGVLTGIACVQSLCKRGIRLPFAIEVVGFADEEGARFQSTYLGSRALAGTFDTTLLERRDSEGISMADALRAFGLDPDRIGDAARKPEDVVAYLELHIEQGPVLESEGLAVGAVTAIAGATRLVVTVTGVAGHAGTVPMALRQDALMAASECVLVVEKVAAAQPNGVGTVGRMSVEPGATNVVPGTVIFSVDLRAAEDESRQTAVAELESRLREIAARRSVDVAVETVHEAASVSCAPRIVEQIDQAIEELGGRIFRLPSGAGHDAAAMADITDVGMIFLRCKDGISHNPDESITEDDAAAGTSLLLKIIENFKLKT
jgi:allantoate deiminase